MFQSAWDNLYEVAGDLAYVYFIFVGLVVSGLIFGCVYNCYQTYIFVSKPDSSGEDFLEDLTPDEDGYYPNEPHPRHTIYPGSRTVWLLPEVPTEEPIVILPFNGRLGVKVRNRLNLRRV